MNLWDILILLAVAAAVILAFVSIRRQKKTGKGCCGTSSCSGNCSLCQLPCGKKQ